MQKLIGIFAAIIELIFIGSFLNEIVKLIDTTTDEGSLFVLGLLLVGIIGLSFIVLKTIK